MHKKAVNPILFSLRHKLLDLFSEVFLTKVILKIVLEFAQKGKNIFYRHFKLRVDSQSINQRVSEALCFFATSEFILVAQAEPSVCCWDWRAD